MASCERCWSDAYLLAVVRGVPQADVYEDLIRDVTEGHRRPCTPREQAGQWWDEARQCDSRVPREPR